MKCDECGKLWDGQGRFHTFETQPAITRTMCDECYEKHAASVRATQRAKVYSEPPPWRAKWLSPAKSPKP
jgi:hypothetical protein